MKRAFTLVEMLVVIGIISVLVAASLLSFSKIRKSAERARAAELVSQVKTAIEAVYDTDGMWPKKLREKSSESDSILDDEAAYVLAKRGMLALSYQQDSGMTGVDRFGILSPWGVDAVKRRGADCTLTTPVNATSTIKDHLLRFKIDLDGDGRLSGSHAAVVGGSSVDIRARVAVWCAGKDGKMESYRQGLKADDVYSWAPGHATNVK